jgi:hypothetical protein
MSPRGALFLLSCAIGCSTEVQTGAVLRGFTEAGSRLEFRVDGIEDGLFEGAVALYALSVRSEGEAHFRGYCLPDQEGRALAIPVRGAWDRSGAFRNDPHLITLACTDGAIAKCIRAGFKPWERTRGGDPLEYHLACVRMIRADYCGDGVAHTREGVRIEVWDESAVQDHDPLDESTVFEAAWGPNGATYLNRPRLGNAVEDIVSACPAKLSGRTSKDVRVALSDVVRLFPEARLFNAYKAQGQMREGN